MLVARDSQDTYARKALGLVIALGVIILSLAAIACGTESNSTESKIPTPTAMAKIEHTEGELEPRVQEVPLYVQYTVFYGGSNDFMDGTKFDHSGQPTSREKLKEAGGFDISEDHGRNSFVFWSSQRDRSAISQWFDDAKWKVRNDPQSELRMVWHFRGRMDGK